MTENRARSEDDKQTSSPGTTPQNVVDQIFGKSPQSNQQERSNLEVAIFLLTRPVSICILAGLFLTILIVVMVPEDNGPGLLFVWGAIILALWIKTPRRKVKTENKESPWLTAAKIVGALFMVFAINESQRFDREQARQNMNRTMNQQGSYEKSLKAGSNHRYWRSTIQELHPYRFVHADVGKEPMNTFYPRYLKEYKQAIENAQFANNANVDHDLLDLSHRLLDVDQESVELSERVLNILESQQISLPDTSVQQGIDRYHEFLNQVYADPSLLDTIPNVEFRNMLARIMEIDMGYLDRFTEIAAMQARLQERYPNFPFALPE